MAMAPPGTMPTDQVLNGPPPSPAVETGMSPGASPSPDRPADIAGLMPPLPSGQFPPDVLTGVLQSGEKMSEHIDAIAQMFPDLAPDFALVKEFLQRALAKVLVAGGGPTSPTAPGPNFPGGGIDRAGATLASGV